MRSIPLRTVLRAIATLALHLVPATSLAQWPDKTHLDRVLRAEGIDPASFVVEPGPLEITRFRIHLHHRVSIPCDGPRGCYAASDLLEISVRCPVRAAALHRRISFDLNGSVVAIAEPDPHLKARFTIPPPLSLEDHVVRRYCGPPPDLPNRD